jgi:hypothetical protein
MYTVQSISLCITTITYLIPERFILNDMYIFGVGAGLNSKGQGYNALNTTVGGIGYGYTYAGWNGNIRYTTPAFAGGFKATAGIFEPNSIGSDNSNGVSGTKTTVPRFEGGLNWAGKISTAPTALYANATWQQAGLTGTPTLITGQTYSGNAKNVYVFGGEVGGKVSIGNVDLVAHGYYGEGMGLSGAQLSFDSIDAMTCRSGGWHGRPAIGGWVRAAPWCRRSMGSGGGRGQ